jgi:hypothetical protein
MRALAEILTAHAPYLSKNTDNKLCLRCLDDSTHGEFSTIEEWSEHVATEITRAGWRKTPATPKQEAGLF